MSLFKKKSEKKDRYNILAEKKTKRKKMKIHFNHETWEFIILSAKDEKKIIKGMDDLKEPFYAFRHNEKDYYVNKNQVTIYTIQPEKTTVDVYFDDESDALGFVETLRLDKWEHIRENHGRLQTIF